MAKLRRWFTSITAIDPRNGCLCNWKGPDIIAESRDLAQAFCNESGRGYCVVIGEYVGKYKCGVIPDCGEHIFTLPDKN